MSEGPRTSRARLGKLIIHPFLLSIYPVLWLYSANTMEVRPSDILIPLWIALGLCVSIWLLTGFVFGSIAKGAMAASLTMLMLLLFRPAHEGFMGLTGWSVRNHLALPAWLVLYAGGLLLIWRSGRGLNAVTRLANLSSVIALVLIAGPIVSFLIPLAFSPDRAADRHLFSADTLPEWVGEYNRAGRTRPDIYYIILDGYGRADYLKKGYGFDNHEFLDGLRSLGFVVSDRSTANYPTTQESLASSLNMDYLPFVEEDGRYARPGGSLPTLPYGDLYTRIEYNKVAQLLRALGYEYLLVPSGVHLTDRSDLADRIVDSGVLTRSTLFSMLVETSVLRCALDMTAEVAGQLLSQARTFGVMESVSGLTQWHRHITDSISAIGEIPRIKAPTFTFAHIVCPHHPHVFERDGSLNTRSTMLDLSKMDRRRHNPWDSPAYVEQMIHLNKLVGAAVRRILDESSTPPIIILQSDHGPFVLAKDRIHDSYANPSDESIRERLSILLAFHGPHGAQAKLGESVSAVNLFRIIFNECFSAAYPLLPDRYAWWDLKAQREVTDVVLTGETASSEPLAMPSPPPIPAQSAEQTVAGISLSE